MEIPNPTPIYHLTHINNLESIIQSGGFLSTNLKKEQLVPHVNIAYETIQERRARKIVPCGTGGLLHDYIPFYFAPRCPMLYAIKGGYVEGYNEGQGPLIHLVTSAQEVDTTGCEWVFTDGHATMAITDFFDDLNHLDEIDWNVMRSAYSNDTPEHPDRKRRRQAEFLIKNYCPWELIDEIGVINSTTKSLVNKILHGSAHRPLFKVQRSWYY